MPKTSPTIARGFGKEEGGGFWFTLRLKKRRRVGNGHTKEPARIFKGLLRHYFFRRCKGKSGAPQLGLLSEKNKKNGR